MDLSGGELQKAALFKVILTEPDVILLDEPTKGLDPFAKEELGAAFQEWTAQGKCLVLVTHDIEFSARYAHRCAFLFDGGIVSQEAPDLFFTTNQFLYHRRLQNVPGYFRRSGDWGRGDPLCVWR